MLIINNELENKHRKRRELIQNMNTMKELLLANISYTLKFSLLYHFTKTASKLGKKLVDKCAKKMHNLLNSKQLTYLKKKSSFITNTIHNLSSYQLTSEETLALSHGLEQHIPTNLNKNDVQTEFECLYENISKNIPTMSEDEKSTLKKKLQNACEKYGKLKTPFKQRQTIKILVNNKDIIIMRQD